MKQTLYFSEEFLSKLKEKAKKRGLCMSAYIRMVLMEKWEMEEK